MTKLRIVWHCIFISLPFAALLGFSVWFYARALPRIEERERRWLENEAKNFAAELKENDAARAFIWQYGEGVVDGNWRWRERFPAKMKWKDWKLRNSRTKHSWEKMDGEILVWVRVGDKIHGGFPGIETTDYRMLFWIFAPSLLAAMACAAALAVHSLVAYAKSREDFLAATAHDLTTPLAAMRLLIGADDEEAKILAERMVRMVGNICGFLRLGGRRRYKKEVFDLRAAYAEAYRLFAADYRDLFDGEDVAILQDDGAPCLAAADELATVQIIWNILGNDLKYAAPYGRVAVRFSSADGMAALSFFDDGPGMDFTQRRHAFERFWRAKSVLESGKGGFGIGLGVSRDAARAMGGALTLAPNTPRGCVFTLALPAAGV